MLERVAYQLDEPVANATVLPMYKLASFAKQTATVVLGGDGGDELFGGYERYRLSHAASLYQNVVPSFMRGLMSHPALDKLHIAPGVERIKLFMTQKEKELAPI